MAGCQTIDFKDVTMIVEKLSLPTARDLAEYYPIADYAADVNNMKNRIDRS
jgi:hypothetical protein